MSTLRPTRSACLRAALFALPLAACGSTGDQSISLAQAIPLPVVASAPADDGRMATLAKQATLEEALDNETHGWRNPQSGAYGTVTPLRTLSGGCRQYRETVYQDGREASRVDTACRNGSGVWVVTRD